MYQQVQFCQTKGDEHVGM